jgi:urea transport system substrate-binding protein
LKHRHRRWLALVLAVLAVVAVACGDDDTADTTSGGGASGDGATTTPSGGGGDTIKVGILHSLSGTMSISEVTVHNAN